MTTETFAAVAFLILVVNRLVSGLFTPIFDKFGWDKFWLMYVAWVLGAALTIVAGLNLFASYLPATVGLILTGIVAGGGSNLLHDIFDKDI